MTAFSTMTLPQTDQFDAWRQWFFPMFDIECETPTGQFLASNAVWNLDGVLLSCVSAPAVVMKRSKTNISRVPTDHWVLTCCQHGSTVIETGNSFLEAPAGVPFLWSLGDRSTSKRTHVRRAQIMLARDTFQDLAGVLDTSRGSLLNSPQGIVLGQYIMALETWLESLPPELVPRLGEAVRSMVVACLSPTGDRLHEAAGAINSFRTERVRRVVRDNLRSPKLTPERICKMTGISRSSLYRLFEYHGGIVHYIHKQRLKRAFEMLYDPNVTTSMLDISETLCFSDASSFSRAFKREYGCNPRDVRAAALNGQAMPKPLPTVKDNNPANFLDNFRE